MCVHACVHMCMMVLCVNVWEVLRGRAGIRAGQGGVCCLPCLPSPVTVWCDVRSQSVLTPRIILKTHTSPPSANLLSHAQSRAEPAWKCVRAETISWLIQVSKNVKIISGLVECLMSNICWLQLLSCETFTFMQSTPLGMDLLSLCHLVLCVHITFWPYSTTIPKTLSHCARCFKCKTEC